MANLKTLAPMLLLLGCSSSAEDDESFTCEQADRSGTYFAEFETVDGNCPDQTSALVRLDPNSTPASNGCVEISPALWSEGNCKLETRGWCPIDARLGAESTIVSTQQDAAGDQITGLMTLTVDDLGTIVCSGTFRFTATRQ